MEMSGKNLVWIKLSMAYLKFGTVSVFSGLFWLLVPKLCKKH